jgi:hypothetical protein
MRVQLISFQLQHNRMDHRIEGTGERLDMD